MGQKTYEMEQKRYEMVHFIPFLLQTLLDIIHEHAEKESTHSDVYLIQSKPQVLVPKT